MNNCNWNRRTLFHHGDSVARGYNQQIQLIVSYGFDRSDRPITVRAIQNDIIYAKFVKDRAKFNSVDACWRNVPVGEWFIRIACVFDQFFKGAHAHIGADKQEIGIGS